MNLEEFKKYLLEKENCVPDYCKKEKIKYHNCDIYSPQFNGKNVGMPMFFLVNNNDKIRSCDNKELFEILNLLDKEN